MRTLLFFYLLAFVAANLIVSFFGPPGLWISSFLLIPFDFVVRCVIHEKFKGIQLVTLLFTLTCAAAALTVILNINALNIAFASIAGFTMAQISAGIFYQLALSHRRSYFFKVNISDLVAIISDSIIFQVVAFHNLDLFITGGQIIIKFAGGLLWYFIIFKKLKLHEKIKSF